MLNYLGANNVKSWIFIVIAFIFIDIFHAALKRKSKDGGS